MTTSTLPTSTGTTPDGMLRATWRVVLEDRPVTGMGSVSILTRAANCSALPSTVTAGGSTVTDAISKPPAGVPVTIGATGTVLDVRSVKTGMSTWTVVGSTLIGLTGLPSWSIGVRGTSWLTVNPPGWITTVARAATTASTTDAGPVTLTDSGVTVVAPTSVPSGGAPRSTVTGTDRVLMSSSWTVITSGSTLITRIRSSVALTMTGADWGPAPGSIRLRSTLATNVDAIGWTLDGAR